MRCVRIIKRFGYLALGTVAAAISVSCGDGGSGASTPAFNKADSSHVIGYKLGRDLGKMANEIKETGVEFNEKIFFMAMKEVLDGVPSQLSDSALKVADSKFRREISIKSREKLMRLEEDNLKASNDFLAENKAKPDVIVTESGLQYVILKAGSGPKPTLTDRVKVHYHGMLPDGKVFDSSIDRNEPAAFPVGGLISGWMEALQLMPVGSKFRIVVPPDLAYGKNGAGPIGPNQVLVFEMELLDIEK
ncbi:MAG: FKBP-type peptidyl-prolyl cis-trans isomerase [Chitinispirillales bacterium]|jgi:FKBP-type peptidyl-prolyl cis-trans isomerase|nr:FKBP-type peptidyl-prolyl cis-trans isomerase [Chitinispirillales bacterium]